jgi:hypothetical protein
MSSSAQNAFNIKSMMEELSSILEPRYNGSAAPAGAAAAAVPGPIEEAADDMFAFGNMLDVLGDIAIDTDVNPEIRQDAVEVLNEVKQAIEEGSKGEKMTDDVVLRRSKRIAAKILAMKERGMKVIESAKVSSAPKRKSRAKSRVKAHPRNNRKSPTRRKAENRNRSRTYRRSRSRSPLRGNASRNGRGRAHRSRSTSRNDRRKHVIAQLNAIKERKERQHGPDSKNTRSLKYAMGALVRKGDIEAAKVYYQALGARTNRAANNDAALVDYGFLKY